MSNLLALICENCGQPLRKEGDLYVCPYCGSTYQEDRQEEIASAIEEALSAQKIEQLANARKLLYDAVHAKYPSRDAVVSNARLVLSIHPDEPLAEIYLHSHDEDQYELVHLLSSANLDPFRANEIYRWLLPSLSYRTVGPLKDFVDRHFKDKDKTERINAIEEEAAKIEEGIYVHTLARDVFLAYSSADMDKVVPIIDLLEENGLTVFAAFRNMRHGKGAQENYLTLLKEAMASCKTFVFLSSNNSRQMTCDALKVELPYLTVNLPKKKRIEFLLNDYSPRMPLMVRKTLKDAFPEQEQCREEDDLVVRIYDLINSKEEDEEAKKRAFEEETKRRLEAEFKQKLENERKAKELEEANRKAALEKQRLEAIQKEQEAKRKAEEEQAKKKAEEERKAKEAELERQRLAAEKAKQAQAQKTDGRPQQKGLSQNALLQQAMKQRLIEDINKTNAYKPGDIVYLGSYPTSLTSPKSGDARKTVDGFYYHPIPWRILEVRGTVLKEAILISEYVLDVGDWEGVQAFLGRKKSSVPSFEEAAFSEAERKLLKNIEEGKKGRIGLLSPTSGKKGIPIGNYFPKPPKNSQNESEAKALITPFAYTRLDSRLTSGKGFFGSYWLEDQYGVDQNGNYPAERPNNSILHPDLPARGIRPIIVIEPSFLAAKNIERIDYASFQAKEGEIKNKYDSLWQITLEPSADVFAFSGPVPKVWVIPEGVIGFGYSNKNLRNPVDIDCMVLPKSLKYFNCYDRYVTVLERFEVHPDNPNFSVKDGVLYNKDGTVLVAVPRNRCQKKMVIPEGVKEIGHKAFAHCEIKGGLVFPQSLETIGNMAFWRTCFCAQMTNSEIQNKSSNRNKAGDIVLPPNLLTIEDDAFMSTFARTIFIPQSVSKFGKLALGGDFGEVRFEIKKPLFGFPKGYDKGTLEGCRCPNISWGAKIPENK